MMKMMTKYMQELQQTLKKPFSFRMHGHSNICSYMLYIKMNLAYNNELK